MHQSQPTDQRKHTKFQREPQITVGTGKSHDCEALGQHAIDTGRTVAGSASTNGFGVPTLVLVRLGKFVGVTEYDLPLAVF